MLWLLNCLSLLCISSIQRHILGMARSVSERVTHTWMIPVHKGDDGAREQKPEYIADCSSNVSEKATVHRWFQCTSWWRKMMRSKTLSVAMSMGDALGGSARWSHARSLDSWCSPPFTIHLLEQSTNGICYDEDLLEQSADRNCIFTTWSMTSISWSLDFVLCPLLVDFWLPDLMAHPTSLIHYNAITCKHLYYQAYKWVWSIHIL